MRIVAIVGVGLLACVVDCMVFAMEDLVSATKLVSRIVIEVWSLLSSERLGILSSNAFSLGMT